MSFNPQSHLIKVDTSNGKKDYLPLQGRLLWLTGEVTEYSIETELLHLDLDREYEKDVWVWDEVAKRKVQVHKTAKGVAVYHAVLSIFNEGKLIKKTAGDKMETACDFPDFLEKAQSGAIGRCLMFAGYGTQFALELDEGERVVDSPQSGGNGHAAPDAPALTVEGLHKLTEQAYGTIEKWGAIKTYLQLQDIADSELQPAQLAKIHGTLIAKIKDNQSKKKAK